MEDYKEGFSKAQSGGSMKNGLERDKAEDRKTNWVRTSRVTFAKSHSLAETELQFLHLKMRVIIPTR